MAHDRTEIDGTTSYPLRPPAPAGGESGGPTSRGAGWLLGGRYRLRGRLGHGGMGTVWRALDELVDREVAVKEPLVPDSVPESQRATVYERMQREARAAARISHPAVVTVHDVVTEDGRPWLVMELVRGESLADVLDTGTLEVREAARVGLAVVNALAAAHAAGVTHRDVKPANVLLDQDDRVVLTDFGIAQVEGEQGLTDTGSLIGSPEFMAPERVLGQRPGPASDLWSLGLLLYVAVEGVSPFRRNTTAATFQAVMSAEPQRPVRAAGQLGDLIARLLDKRPEARPDAAESRRALHEILTSSAAPTRAVDIPAAPARPRFGRRSRVGLALALALVTTAALWVTDPLGGDDLPEGWKVEDEEDFGMSIAVPEEYVRTVNAEEDNNHLIYRSPDGIYTVRVWLRRGETRGVVDAASATHVEYQDGTMVYDDGNVRETRFQDRGAAELNVLNRTEEDAPRAQRLALFYGLEDEELMWRVQVQMPGEDGPPKTHGEELYADIIEHLELNVPED
ncbi:serine/threonine-protein kinase [Streptomyces mayteni]